MKLVVFAHVPPPHHGQAVMVQIMLDGLRGRDDIEVFHVDARVSDDIGDVGGIRPAKLLRLLKFCVQAVWFRLRYRADTLYYVPAPAKKSAIVRDWLVMLLVRPWFRRTIFHWHAFGLGHWATSTTEHPGGTPASASGAPHRDNTSGGTPASASGFPEKMPGSDHVKMTSSTSHTNSPALAPPIIFPPTIEPLAKSLTRRLLGRADLSIVLTDYNRCDAKLLDPKRIEIVPNGIPDPCPDFETTVLPARQARLANRLNALDVERSMLNVECSFRVLFLAHCTREKGLFDAIDAIVEANRLLAEQSKIENRKSKITISLTVAGSFMDSATRAEFDDKLRAANEAISSFIPHSSSFIRFAGFLDPIAKDATLRDHDCLMAPSHWESFGLTVVEAMAYGMPSIISSQPNLAALTPESMRLSAPIGDVPALAELLVSTLAASFFAPLRRHYLENFSVERFQSNFRAALKAFDCP